MAEYNTSKINAAGGLTLDHVPTKSGIGVQAISVTYAVAVALVTNDTINLFKVPSGATILDFKLSSDGDLGSTASLVVGDAGVDNRYMVSTAFTNAAGAGGTLAYTGAGYVTTAETTFVLKAASMAAGTTDASIRASVLFTMNP
jgi:hypothetical protein